MRQIQESHRQTLIQELKRVIEQKDAFMSSVSHELRTPLNGIIGEQPGHNAVRTVAVLSCWCPVKCMAGVLLILVARISNSLGCGSHVYE